MSYALKWSIENQPGRVSTNGGIHHQFIIHPEHVAADPLALVVPFPVVRQDGTDLLTRVLNHL